MAATLNITINMSNGTIQNLIDSNFRTGTTPVATLTRILDFITKIEGGFTSGATVIITARDTDPSVGTSGSGSVQTTITKT